MRRKELLMLSVGIFLTVVAWLIADIFHASTEEKIKSRVELPTNTSYRISSELLEILENKVQ